jgi:hypothetical protein
VKESFTAAIVVRSLWAAERSSWVVGVLVGWVVLRLAVCWPVSVDVVVAVDMQWFLFVVCESCWIGGGGQGLVADSSQLSADSSLPEPDSSLFAFRGL